MFDYEINDDTLAIISISENKSRIIETNDEYIVDKSAYEIMDDSCKYYGSSYEGRVIGSKAILNAEYKLPIVVEEDRRLIFFPTNSPLLDDCIWISLKHFKKIGKNQRKALIYFNNGKIIKTNVSSYSLNNQFLRATLLESILNHRKTVKNG